VKILWDRRLGFSDVDDKDNVISMNVNDLMSAYQPNVLDGKTLWKSENNPDHTIGILGG
jgi:hypothetical protein